MIKLEWENQTSFLLRGIKRIQAMAKENKHLFYITVPMSVYKHIKKIGINATVEVVEKEIITTIGSSVLLKISRKENLLKG
jgi:hypothetical protein